MIILNRVAILVLVTTFGLVTSSCAPSTLNNANIYASDPQTVVIYADLEMNSGAPRSGVTCRFPSVPVLRVGGDGLTFVRILDRTGTTDDKLYKGILSSQQVGELLDYLTGQGFFGDWTPEVASPAANDLNVGINLVTHSNARAFSSLEPVFYRGLLGRLTSALAPITPADIVEPRIHDLNTTRECTTATPRNASSGNTLDDQTLEATALELAHTSGLQGNPTAKRIAHMTLSQWMALQGVELTQGAIQLGMNPTMPVFVLALRGNVIGQHPFSGQTALEQYNNIIVAVNASNGNPITIRTARDPSTMPIQVPLNALTPTVPIRYAPTQPPSTPPTLAPRATLTPTPMHSVLPRPTS